ncbi:hypothetical protein BH23GEM3_BH23GEM3_00270 [soil metagenome]
MEAGTQPVKEPDFRNVPDGGRTPDRGRRRLAPACRAERVSGGVTAETGMSGYPYPDLPGARE